jgi:hypothetical protein
MLTLSPVIENELLAGFEIVIVITEEAPPKTGLALVTDMVGRLEFEAKTGVVTGTRKRRPEIARSARIVPELNFFTYAFVSVFNIFEPTGLNRLYKGNGRIVHISRTIDGAHLSVGSLEPLEVQARFHGPSRGHFGGQEPKTRSETAISPEVSSLQD